MMSAALSRKLAYSPVHISQPALADSRLLLARLVDVLDLIRIDCMRRRCHFWPIAAT